MRTLLFALILGISWPVASTADVAPLEQLLLQVKEARQQQTKIRQQREQEFLARKAEQQQLLEQMQQRLAAEHERSKQLKAAFEANEEELGTLETELKQRSGDLGEVFGTVRQSSKDLSALIQESLVSAQYPDRVDWLHGLSEHKKLPAITELRQLWRLVQEEIAESGRVVRFPATVIDAGGVAHQEPVIRVGLFNALAGNRYLKYQAESGRFVVLPRQPASDIRDTAEAFGNTREGYAELALDPTRGVLLGLLVETPDWLERLHQGGAVGYVILALGAFGLLLVAVRLVYLSWIGARVRRQLQNLTAPLEDNPLGRLLLVAVQHRHIDLNNLEMKIDETVLREVPRLTRGEGLLKLLAGVAPLLGLLGTVVGMIITFQAISLFGTGDPKLMANGISQALVTTALGLIVAIPLLFMHTLLTTRSRVLVQILDEQSAGLVAMSREQENAANG